ncbi:MAG: ester cyclase [Chloroflexi bacterium]|nr:ester cyclase [Chloroflexota bacterium]
MTREEIKVLVGRFYEDVINKRELAVADEIFALNWVGYDPTSPNPLSGPEGVKREMTMYLSAFPDLRFTVEDLIAAGDKAVVRVTVRGTHKGELMGILPTFKECVVTGIDIHRLYGDRIVETWSNWDALGLLQQLGVVSLPGEGEIGSAKAA